MNYILANTETNEERPYPRQDGGDVVGLQDPPWVVLTVIQDPYPNLEENQTAIPSKTKDYGSRIITYGWDVIDNPPPGPDYQGFYDALIASSVYQVVVQTEGKTGDQAAAMTVFLGAIQETKNIKENPPALQAAIWKLLSEITLAEEGYNELEQMMTQYRLDEIYQLQPPQ